MRQAELSATSCAIKLRDYSRLKGKLLWLNGTNCNSGNFQVEYIKKNLEVMRKKKGKQFGFDE